MTSTIKVMVENFLFKFEKSYNKTVIDFNEVDMRIYLPLKVIFTSV